MELVKYFVEKANENFIRLFISTENISQNYYSEYSNTDLDKTFSEISQNSNALVYLISNFHQWNAMEILKLLLTSDVMLKIEIQDIAKTVSQSQEYVAKMTSKFDNRVESEDADKNEDDDSKTKTSFRKTVLKDLRRFDNSNNLEGKL